MPRPIAEPPPTSRASMRTPAAVAAVMGTRGRAACRSIGGRPVNRQRTKGATRVASNTGRQRATKGPQKEAAPGKFARCAAGGTFVQKGPVWFEACGGWALCKCQQTEAPVWLEACKQRAP
eukprot:4722539-Prymnesium_polylepis.1